MSTHTLRLVVLETRPPVHNGLPPARMMNHPHTGRYCPLCGRRVEFWDPSKVCEHPR